MEDKIAKNIRDLVSNSPYENEKFQNVSFIGFD